MVIAATVANRDVSATLKFITPTSKSNRRYVAPGQEAFTGVYEDKEVIIKDARPGRSDFSVETSGFALLDHESKVTNFHDMTELNEVYIPEIVTFLKSVTGAHKVIFFEPGPLLRHSNPQSEPTYRPARDVHVDLTSSRAHHLAQTLLANSDEPDLQYSRFQCINSWRTISRPPQDWPLAICDARSVESTEGVPNAIIRVDSIPDLNHLPPLENDSKNPEAFLFEYRQYHRWYYFADMNDDELLVFKLFDSAKEHGRCPHASFLDEGRPRVISRESVEVRTVLYFD